jgi:hypothetical protein
MSASEPLRALRAGRLEGRPVLPAATTREEVEAVLGPSGPGDDAPAVLGDVPATMREYPPSPLAPDGLTAYFDGDALLALEIPYPDLPPGWDEHLGRPTTETPSSLARAHARRAWREARVIAHQHRVTGEVLRLEVLAALDPDALAQEPPPRREQR